MDLMNLHDDMTLRQYAQQYCFNNGMFESQALEVVKRAEEQAKDEKESLFTGMRFDENME